MKISKLALRAAAVDAMGLLAFSRADLAFLQPQITMEVHGTTTGKGRHVTSDE
jgi:hypothetical protein